MSSPPDQRDTGETLADSYREAMRLRKEWGHALGIAGVETPRQIFDAFNWMVGRQGSDPLATSPEAPSSFKELLAHPDPLVCLHAARISELLIGEPAFSIIAEVLSGEYPPQLRIIAIQVVGDLAWIIPAHTSASLKKLLFKDWGFANRSSAALS